MIAKGARARTITYVDRRPLYWVPPGKFGTVTSAGRDFIAIEMDEPIDGLEGCHNQVRFTSENCGLYRWQTWLDTVEQVCRYHFVIYPETSAC